MSEEFFVLTDRPGQAVAALRRKPAHALPLSILRLVSGGGSKVISTIGQITFYGHDQVGNDVSVTGAISINFADWGDPTSGG